MTKKEKELRAKVYEQENEILRRALYWVGAAVLLEIIVLFINRYFFHYKTVDSEIFFANNLLSVFPILQVTGVVFGVACILWAAFDKKRGKKLGLFRFILAGFFISLSVISVLTLHIGSSAIPVLLVGIPAFAGLAMIYYLYQREFFLISICSGLGMFGVWLFRRVNDSHTGLLYGYFIFAFCVVLGICLLSRYLQYHHGAWKRGDRRLQILSGATNYLTIFLSGALVCIALLGSLLLGSVVAYYAMLVLVVWFFIMAVYFTSKLM